MKVFISWSGNLSHKIAQVLNDWLPGVIQSLKPYLSSEMDKGARWESEISKMLEESKFGIICLTPDNINEPWILFEAGAISKGMGKSRVCPILFEIAPSDIEYPLALFQLTSFSKEEILKLLKTINEALEETKLTESQLEQAIDIWWPKLDEKISDVLSSIDRSQRISKRSQIDMLEEILMTVRHLPDSIRLPQLEKLDPRAWTDLKDLYENILLYTLENRESLQNDIIMLIRDLGDPINHILNKFTGEGISARARNLARQLFK